VNAHVQQNQPPGVPALSLTGERTLPDVPAENYWFRRHLAVYEWIAARVVGLRMLDMACGEGYGAEVLSRGAASVVAVDANPEAFEHARLRYQRQNLSFERGLVETFGSPGSFDAVVFLQTIEHVVDPAPVLAHFRELVVPGGIVYVSTPNVLTLAPAGAVKSDNPWHVREYRSAEFGALCASVFDRVEMVGLFHARKLRLHAAALRLGWDAVHARLGVTRAFYDRFTPSISTRDFALRAGSLDAALDFVAMCRR
jgi:2-polyprenyl-3-methyl-5-hydroxy-6-metoxy-1,4-benzoquinol methylase